ncbi:MAG TPA: hypothetical protein VF624_00450 [Tepidisphaeraceae bacterium]|jgi:serine/threonine protein kinase
MTIGEFRTRLRDKGDQTYRSDFRLFLREARDRYGLGTQAELAAFVQLRTSSIRGLDFVRLFDRVTKKGSVSSLNLDRIAHVFGFVSGPLLIDAFLRWRTTRSSTSRGNTVFSFDQNGKRYFLSEQTEFTLNGDRYQVAEPVDSKLGRGVSYAAYKLSNVGSRAEKVFLKTIDLRLGNGSMDLEDRVRKATERLWQEVQIHRTANSIDDGIKGLARVLDYGTLPLDRLNARQLNVPLTVTQWVFGSNLVQMMDRPGQPGAPTRFDVGSLVRHVRDLIRIVARLHGASIVHGDLTPSNVMLDTDSGRIIVVDTGESALPAPDRKHPSGHSQLGGPLPEGGIGGPLDFGHDVYFLGRTIWYMVTGERFPDWKKDTTSHKVRDTIRNKLEGNDDYYRSLLDAEPGLPAMLAQALHPNPAERALQAGDLLETLDLYDRLGQPRLTTGNDSGELVMRLGALRSQITESNQLSREYFLNELRAARSVLDRLTETGGDPEVDAADLLKPLEELLAHSDRIGNNELGVSIFNRVTQHQVALVARRATQMLRYGRLMIEGTRDTLVNVVLDLLATLSHNDAFLTATTPHMWSSGNLGIAGRVLEANHLIARRGVRIRRVIVVNDRSDLTLRMVRAQAVMINRLSKESVPTTGRQLGSEGVFVGVLDAARVKGPLWLDGNHVALAQRGSTTVSLSFQLGQEQTIRALSLWNIRSAPFVEHRLAVLQEAVDKSTEVREWLASHKPPAPSKR